MGEVKGLHERPSLCSLSDCWELKGAAAASRPEANAPHGPQSFLSPRFFPHLTSIFFPTKIQLSLSKCHLRSYSEIIQGQQVPILFPLGSTSHSWSICIFRPSALPKLTQPPLPRQAQVQGGTASAKLPRLHLGFPWWKTPGNVSQAFCLCHSTESSLAAARIWGWPGQLQRQQLLSKNWKLGTHMRLFARMTDNLCHRCKSPAVQHIK